MCWCPDPELYQKSSTLRGRGTRLLWEKKVIYSIDSVSFLMPSSDVIPSTSSVLCCTDDGYQVLVSVEDGRPLTLSLDTTGLVRSAYISVSRDQQTLALAGGSSNFWWNTFTHQKDGSWDRGSTHSLPYRPLGVAWITDDIVILGEGGRLEKFSTDGQQVWAQTKEQTQLTSSLAVAACDQGYLYVSDYVSHCVRVYSSSSGELQDSLSLKDLGASRPLGLCVTPQGTLFIGCQLESKPAVLQLFPDETEWIPMVTDLPELVTSLAISGRHLAVGDWDGTLGLYEVP